MYKRKISVKVQIKKEVTMFISVLMSLLLGSIQITQQNEKYCLSPFSRDFFHYDRSKTTNELLGKYCYWCGQENEGDRTSCKRCGKPL